MKKIKTILVLSFFLLAVSSCTKKEDITKIGVILPLTGDVATYGQSVKRGIDIAYEGEANNKLVLKYEDSKAEKRTAINALEKLFFENTRFFIGDATSTVTYEIGPRIQAKNGILIVPIATGDRIKDIGENIFMMSPRNEKQTNKIVNFIKKDFNSNRIGCLFKQNDYGVNIANTFLKFFEGNAYSQAYQEGQNDFKSLLLKFKSEKINLIFLPGNYEETATILKQSKELNYLPTFIGTDGAYSPKLVELAGKASEGFLLTMMPVDYNSEMYLKFKEKYLQKHNSEPDIFSCYGYESCTIMMKAIKNSPQKTSEEVRKYLESNKFDSLTGELSFDTNGEAKRDYQIYIVKNGNFTSFTRLSQAGHR